MERMPLAVRRVVEWVLRCGDIDSGYADPSDMQEGAKAHRRLQKSMGQDYTSEVSLSLDTMAGDIPVTLHGRADGVITGAEGVTIDEIKTTMMPLERLYGQSPLHFAQAKCYAHMWLCAQENPPASAVIQLTYYHLESHEIRRFQETHTALELRSFVDSLLEDYAVWLHREREWRSIRDASIHSAVFPYGSYRKGQRELAVGVYRTIENSRKLYAQAPTGIGKTLSALFPSIKAMGGGLCGKLFYLTAKTVTRAVAENALSLMERGGLRFKSVTLRAKDKLCFCDETVCTPVGCSYAKGHYDRINSALSGLLDRYDLITAQAVEEIARLHRVCPYELSLDAALWADAVICDYNHVFDPVVYLRRFFADGSENNGDRDYVFLIDEAHNMTDRVRDMYTAALRKSDFLRLGKQVKEKNAHARALRRAANKLNTHMLDIRKAIVGAQTGEPGRYPEHSVSDAPDPTFLSLVKSFAEKAADWIQAERSNTHPAQDDVLTLYFEALEWLGIAEAVFDDHYCVISEALNGGDAQVTLFCLDPSAVIAQRLKHAKATIMFSATLTPLPYYREMLGGCETDGMLALPSPFEPERLLLAAHYGISTKYALREHSYRPVAEIIHTAISRRRGNYLIYFPSYDYMRRVHEIFCERFPEVRTILQDGGMDENARAFFLESFDASNTRTLAGFCVLGGVFSEGIDLQGERLIGTVIVGVGLPGLSVRQELIRDYFQRVRGAGYDYAYVFPGMNKVLQAAGRVIRGENDYGLVLLIDSRYATAQYQSLFPQHWAHLRYIDNGDGLSGLLEGFGCFSNANG